ncbi:MAG TPA: YbhB/YbcL family Raf kinase inhibitor-like protein [Stellaceae bacterium]|nr:YbhB/YbcL family Raf kinase inhibitor-like protein [Stellaceae bacterium]
MATAPAMAAGLVVTSPDLGNGGRMPLATVFNSFGCTGQNRSPALAWSGEPAGTKSFAITMFDPDAPTGSGFWHWTVFNIPPDVHSLAADAGAQGSSAMPQGAGEGRNDYGFSYYGGPCPPPGPAHHYHITVYAVKVARLPLNGDSSGAVVGFNLHFNTLAKGQIIGIYGRAK